MSKLAKFVWEIIPLLILLGIIIAAISIRVINWNPDIILDYDPWWFFRHAQEILDNGFVAPKWDILSFYPPGRPVDYYLGWSFTLAFFYSIVRSFTEISLTQFSGIFVAIFAALSAIPAYLVGRHVTNNWGGLATAFFAVVSVTFLSVSFAGYPDSDAVDVFYTFLAVFTTLYAIKKADKVEFSKQNFVRSSLRYIPYLIPALISYWLFAFNWSSSWYIYFIFLFFIPLLIIFKIIESLIKKEHKFGKTLIVSKVRECKHIIFAILAIGVLGEIISLLTSGWPFNILPPHYQLVTGLNIIGTKNVGLVGFSILFGLLGAIVGLAFGKLREVVIGTIIAVAISILLIFSGVTGESLIVNQSVAELQPIGDIFSGFGAIVARIGAVPMFFAFVAFAITGLKLIFKKEIHTAEYFVIIWLIISLFLITKGVRFSLLFSMATATAAGFTIGNLIIYASKKGSLIMLCAFFAVALVGGIMHFEENRDFAKSASQGLDVSQNWRDALGWLKENADEDALITTWWDPGHIIAGSTGLKVMADGAHCPPGSCIFLDHNIRIQDMGRAFSISSEDDSVKILRKYTSITPAQCQQLERTFPDKFIPESCEPVSEMYVLATADLIGKYYWLSYFGTGQGDTYTTCNLNQGETERNNAPTYICASSPSIFTEISIVEQNSKVLGIMNSWNIDPSGRPISQQVRNAPIKDLVLYNSGNQFAFTANTTSGVNVVDGLVWVDPGFQQIIFMNSNIRDGIFTNMYFFNGEGIKELGIPPLDKYEMVYNNPEVKIFKLDAKDFNRAEQ
jgi:hypothetical protein